MRRLGLQLRHMLWDMTPRDHRQSDRDFRRRQVVSLVVVVIGAVVLAFALGRTDPGSVEFYGSTLLLALVWTVGALASGPLHLGRVGIDETVAARPVVQPILIGLGLAAVFVVGAFIVRLIPPLADQVRNVLEYAGEGSSPLLLLIVTVLNGIAEELFFRGGLYAAIPARPVPITAVAYAIATAATGNVMLAFAALLLGVVVGLERRASGGILAPVLTHLTWSVTMLYALPAILPPIG
ncbi:MAG TPA: CPBP family intramembrane glutamic endopeptidase [Nocardioidaceae bacterium]|nr:CPBP family intramembrane glutamic endopeptidase [Nocardioidaceae bacterium]